MSEEKKELQAVDIAEIMKLLPHRYPFLMVDRIIEIDGDNSAIGVKNVTVNENFFQGHFPAYPVMPGVLLIEGMAQTAGAVCVHHMNSENDMDAQYEPTLVYFMTIDKARFRRPVTPGDQLRYHVKKIRNRGKVWRFRCEARVDGELVAETEISAMVTVDIDAKAIS
jgi:3-hydroxyacyl-[acyl-carrier-protein] dehydratase